MIRCFLQARAVLNRSDLYYLSNKLYVDSYLAWLQCAEVKSVSVRLSEKIECCLLSHDWRAEIDLQLIHPEDTTSVNEASDDDSVADASTGSSETGDSSFDSSNADGESTNLEAKPNRANESPSSLKMDSNPSMKLPEAMLPALENLSLNDDAPRALLVPDATWIRRDKAPLIKELD
jgi:SHQ1 protein